MSRKMSRKMNQKLSSRILQNLCHVLAGLVFMVALNGGAMAQEGLGLPALNMVTQPDGSTTYSLSLQILALMTAVSLLPSLVLGMTSFTRIIIVLSILRQAMGTQQTPPNQVLIAIALFLSLFIMTPTLTAVYDEAVNPYVDQEIAAEEALSTGSTIMTVSYTHLTLPTICSV